GQEALEVLPHLVGARPAVLVKLAPATDRQRIGAPKRKIQPREMQLRQRCAEPRTMGGRWPPDPQAFEKGDDRGRPARDRAEHVTLAVLDRLWAGDAAAREMLHQAEEERQVLGGHPLFVQRENEAAVAGMDQEIRVLDPFRDALVGQQRADIVSRKKLGELFRRNVGVDGHHLLRALLRRIASARQCRRFEVPTPPAATAIGNFKSKSGTRIIALLVPPLFPKFVSEHAETYHELRKRGTSDLRR